MDFRYSSIHWWPTLSTNFNVSQFLLPISQFQAPFRLSSSARLGTVGFRRGWISIKSLGLSWAWRDRRTSAKRTSASWLWETKTAPRPKGNLSTNPPAGPHPRPWPRTCFPSQSGRSFRLFVLAEIVKQILISSQIIL